MSGGSMVTDGFHSKDMLKLMLPPFRNGGRHRFAVWFTVSLAC